MSHMYGLGTGNVILIFTYAEFVECHLVYCSCTPLPPPPPRPPAPFPSPQLLQPPQAAKRVCIHMTNVNRTSNGRLLQTVTLQDCCGWHALSLCDCYHHRHFCHRSAHISSDISFICIASHWPHTFIHTGGIYVYSSTYVYVYSSAYIVTCTYLLCIGMSGQGCNGACGAECCAAHPPA